MCKCSAYVRKQGNWSRKKFLSLLIIGGGSFQKLVWPKRGLGCFWCEAMVIRQNVGLALAKLVWQRPHLSYDVLHICSLLHVVFSEFCPVLPEFQSTADCIFIETVSERVTELLRGLSTRKLTLLRSGCHGSAACRLVVDYFCFKVQLSRVDDYLRISPGSPSPHHVELVSWAASR